MVREIQTRKNQNPYLLREAYRTYDHIVAVSRDIVPSVSSISGEGSGRISVIGNCHDYKDVLRRAEEEPSFDENTLSDHLGVPVMACDVSGPHGFLSEHGGILLNNSTEGILEGMELFARKGAAALSVDYEQANAEAAAMTEELIRQAIDG